MIHQRILDVPCPWCSSRGSFGVLFVSQSQLVRGCSKCNRTEPVPLPELRKTVFYLDQCFLSSAFRANQPRFVRAAERIRSLAARQLLVCPWSSLHETETHQWPNQKQQGLWEFIKKTAAGNKFSHAASIQSSQISRSFHAFFENDLSLGRLDPDDAFARDVHGWDDFHWIDVRMRFDDSADVKRGKETAAKAMVDLIDRWRNKPQTFAEDFRDEWTGYARLIIDEYSRCMLRPDPSKPLALLESNAQILNSLMVEQDMKEPFDTRLERAVSFLKSESFAQVPHIDASCRLMAILRRAVRRGELASHSKAERAMFGFGQDMQMVSVFAPYVDAVFMDRTMHRWIAEADCELPEKYSFRTFSTSNWVEFEDFLEDIERNAPSGHDVWLKAVYG